MESGSQWIEKETECLREQMLQAFANGLYDKEPPLLWIRVAQRMRKRALNHFFSRRMYIPEGCRKQYFTNLKPLLLKTTQTSQGERPWSEDEREALREYISATLPGGLLDGRIMLWQDVAENMFENGLVSWCPFRLYNKHNVREEYSKRIAPRFANTKEIELAFEFAESPPLQPRSTVRSRSLASIKLDTDDTVPASPVSSSSSTTVDWENTTAPTMRPGSSSSATGRFWVQLKASSMG
jgi:hypothetical protein